MGPNGPVASVVPVGREMAGADDAAIRLGKRADRPHFLFLQREVENIEILLEPAVRRPLG